MWGCSGGAAMYSVEMLTEVGSFESSFFLYYEDVDVAWRARAAGWTALCVPAVRAMHEHSASTSHGSDLKLYWTGRNRVRVLMRNSPRRLSLARLLGLLAYDASYVVYYALRRRTLAPLRGRLAGLKYWRTDRKVPKGTIDPFLVPPAGIRAALKRNRVVSSLSANADGPPR